MANVLLFAYYAYKDPVFQSAVLDYFKLLNNKKQRKIVLITFENDRFPITEADIRVITSELATYGIKWYRLSWHSGKFKQLKKILDFFFAFIFTSFLLFKHKIGKVYSEGFPGAIISHFITHIFRKSHIVHTFEPHADYMLETGVWKTGDWEYRFLKRMEKRVAKKASVIITATASYAEVIRSWGIKGTIYTIPSCVDTEKIKFDLSARDNIRRLHNIGSEDIVVTYLGKFGGMYMKNELFQGFRSMVTLFRTKLKIWVFTNENEDWVNRKFFEFDIPKEITLVKYLEKENVSHYLSASDIGIVGIRPCYSRRYSSPIKTSEYLACGLPVVVPKGISDDDEKLAESLVGVVVDDFSNLSKGEQSKISRLPFRERAVMRKYAIANKSIQTFIPEFEKFI